MERCIRYKLEREGGTGPEDNAAPPEWARHMTQLLGCEICQRVCPLNADIAETAPPPHIIAAFAKPHITSPDKEHARAAAEIVGRNYAKRLKRQAELLNSV